MTASKKWSAHAQSRPTVFGLCLPASILLMRKRNHGFSFLWSLLRKNGRSLRFPRIFIKKQARWSNDKTIIELSLRKISWFIWLPCVQSRFVWLTLGGRGHSRGLLASPILCTASSQLLFQNFSCANDLAGYAGYRSKNSVRWKCPNYFCLRLWLWGVIKAI